MTRMKHLHDYDAWIATHRDYVEHLRRRVIDELDDAGLAFDQVTIRIKDRESYAKKIANPALPDYKDFRSAHDIIGIRVITFHSSQIPQLVDVLSDLFDVVSVIDKAAETAKEGRFGYASQHLIVQEDGQLIEIQLRTVLQHAWAEFEHDVRYKNPQHDDPQIARAFTLAAGLIELADQQFDKVADIVESVRDGRASGTLEASHLPKQITRLVGEDYPMSRADYYTYAIDMLAAHDLTTVDDLADLLAPENITQLTTAMGYRFKPGQVRLVDDMLLFTYGREHIRKTVHIGETTASRPGRLGTRWQQLGQRTINE
ncbi:hypothetical protein F7230_08825 [Corynebacterium sp. 320]|nr:MULTISPECIES: hypothetical protein [Corynebacterium]MCR5914412.1 hypothetical protein [Corynebacterium sp. zg254]KAB1502523.1 hypothetical protein F7230_08825 [Corynebacterium sp. 320]KAB1551256.1 hypothetical protein F7233_06955 [Corynebacterium sp. 321]KAB1551916.1 hypothetical protein F7232_07315 [Corynebacterium sp. 319]KAB3526130.1 hypothetical protein F8354_08825 [Corynebacterium sp. 250]